MCENALALTDKSPSCIRNALSRGISTLSKKTSVAKKMLSHGIEAAVLLAQRGNEVLEEEVCSGGERDRVRDGSFEAVGVDFDCVEDLEDCG